MEDKIVAERVTALDGSDGATTSSGAMPTHAGQQYQQSKDHSAPEVVGAPMGNKVEEVAVNDHEVTASEEEIEATNKGGRFAYFRTRNFYVVLVLGQVLSLCITGTSTFSSLLATHNFSIPAFQSLSNYLLLTLIYLPLTILRLGGPRPFARQTLLTHGWKYLLLSFCDVEGNYFTVLAYRYTTILSAQLINFWAIVMVVIISSTFLKVRYHWAQILGIVICIGGFGILLGSDHLTGATSPENPIPRSSQVKGDLFALLGATFYGLSNVAEEYLLSTRPLYETVSMLGLFGCLITGIQASIFDRSNFRTASWKPRNVIGGYLTGYTLLLSLFYSLAPILFRMGSAAFLNISLLTANFWAAIIGTRVFGLSVHYLYPVAFVCIVGGLIIYHVGKQAWGEAVKPWLGKGQEKGISGVGTAKRRAERPHVVV